MKKRRIWLNIVGIAVILSRFCLLAGSDTFYYKTLTDGKRFYSEKKYEEALESFRIAEFGLLEEPESLKELYLFYALTYYKLSKFQDSRDILEKYKKNLDVESLNPREVPATIRNDVKIMVATLKNTRGSQAASVADKKNLELVRSFEMIFQDTWRMLEKNQFADVKKGIRKLIQLDDRDPRADYLSGILYFKKRNYRDCIETLRSVYKSIGDEHRDTAAYYLVLSFYFEKNYGQALAFYQKINNSEDKNKLQSIINKIVAERKQAIARLSSNLDKKYLEDVFTLFPGDQFLCGDILEGILKSPSPDKRVVEDIIEECLRHSLSVNQEFFLLAANFLDGIQKTKSAIKMIEKSPFSREKEQGHIEIHYQLGRLYYKIGSLRKALKQFMMVNEIQEGYKEVRLFIQKIENRS